MKPRLQNGYKIFIVFLLVFISLTSNFTVTEAAKRDRTSPTAPTNLKAAAITASTVSLTWTSSTDNVGVKEYDVYRNNTYIGNTTTNSYSAGNLSPSTSYSFFVKARDASGNISPASNTITVSTSAPAVDQPPQVGSIQVSPIASDGQTIGGTVTLSVSASDDKGISKVEFYSNNGGYLIGARTSAPYSMNWATDPWVPDGSQTLKVIVYDTANQTAQVSKTVLVKNTVTPEPAAYKKVGYFTGWSTYSNFQVADIDASALTHLNYAFANISSDGKIALGDSWADVEKPFSGDTADQPYKGNFYQLTKLKQQYPHLKTLISVGGWTWSERFSDVALTEQSRTIFAESALQFLLKYGFDGVDLDWEYPVGGGEADNINRPEDKQNFTLLLKKIRETLDAQSAKDGKTYLLTIAAGAGSSYAANTELNLIHQYVDYIQLMTYDIHGSWDGITGMNAPLYRDPESGFSWEWSVQDTSRLFLNQGVPANKLIMGIPFYGRAYNQVTNHNNGLYQSFTGSGSALSYANLEANYVNKNGFTRYWEPDSKVPWLFNGSQFISYDDTESIGYKTSFIKANSLGGAMMWELSQDPNRVLLSKIFNDLK
ncbi:fibronectin type III domain-containing protein [Bacillus sp. EB106-08-02-XG196]|uniref:glycosyl hydrolase family 18 protein n=1 Tax=Bacillus sp. EB106-08-02-XG196 TaxID=2737049 RepID=UPI0015C4DE68|nr:glycosyl hydrolase family 18 protein [Bacillus sp. EB106-08-02-XG196]NWQ43403.1 fibronectin type III domain-containing protein [Bacillus sp. EB106-08-02-XG196]